MRLNKGWTLVLCVLVLSLVATPLLAQQQTGDLVIKVTDPSKAVIPDAKVTIASPGLIRPVEGKTDADGLFFARSLPSGKYRVVVEKTGFKQAVHEAVAVEIGKSYTVEMPLAMGVTSETIEVSANAVQIDTVKSESAQVYQGEALTTLPGARTADDFVRLAPSVNKESFAGGISVDGASGSENQFYVDGVTTSNIFNGENNQSIRTEIVQEMQVKTGGYDAEFGGAMGGVVSVVTKSGTNDFHGMGYYYYGGSGLDGCFLNFSGSNSGNGYNCHRVYIDPTDSSKYVDRKFGSDHYTNNEVGVNLGGPIWKDKAFFFINVNPSWKNITRNTMLNDGVAQDFQQKQTRRAGLAKVDIQPFDRLRLFVNYSQDTFRYKGALPNYVTYKDPSSGQEVGVDQNTYDWRGEGYKYPTYSFGGGATWTVTPRILIDSRYGFNGTDTIQFLQPTVPTRYVVSNSSSVVGWSPSLPNGDQGYAPAFSYNQNPSSVYATTQDYEKKLAWTTTGSATFNLAGVHNFKAGYTWERWALDIASAHIYDYLLFYFGKTYTDLNNNVDTSSCVGPDGNTYDPCGYLQVRSPFGEIAKLHTDHNAFFFQDSWTIGRRLTINPGVRFESEEIPSFSTIPQYAHAAVKWGFGDKIAPRFGASFDLFGNGKAKIYGSWGRFYDQMKLTMAEGSFGGFKWHSQYYLLNSDAVANWYNMGGPHDANSFTANCNGSLTGGTTTCSGFPTGGVDLPFIEDRDWRLPSFDTLDPAIKPMRMQNATVGTEWQLPRNWIFSFQFVHKQLDRTIEDVGTLTPLGEQYYITNPGFGYSVSKFMDAGLPPTPKAKRNYNAGEFRMRRQFGGGWMADFSYTYSKLYGNYGGLASSDEDTSNGIGQGRTDPNVERYFDEWYLSYQANNGKLAYGPLNTDRPHQIKINGTYQLPKNLPKVSAFYNLQSGTPITTIATVENSEMIMNGRGDLGRLPWNSQTDLSIIQVFKPFKSESKSIEFSVNVLNLFNQQAALHKYRNITEGSVTYGYLSPTDTGAGPNWAAGSDLTAVNTFLGHGWNGTGDWMTSVQAFDAANGGSIIDPRYNKADLWQLPTRVRLGLRFTF